MTAPTAKRAWLGCQFADDELCGPHYIYAPSADLLAGLPLGDAKSFGIGCQFRDKKPALREFANIAF